MRRGRGGAKRHHPTRERVIEGEPVEVRKLAEEEQTKLSLMLFTQLSSISDCLRLI
ncbi:MAG: hypothetical protein ACXQTW_08390 [Candidatus Methanospirareceae archaeon]